MHIVYVWEFLKFNVYNSTNSLENVVYSIEWCLSASDEAGHGAQTYGTTFFDTPDPLTFTPFEQLTQPQVEDWVISALGDQLAEYQQILQNNIQAQMQPVTSTLTKPW
jgi:hypothetical protein